jgi:TolB-like protein/predicted Ser/Thr protein kinase
MAADESHDDKTQSFIALTSGTVVLHYRIVEKIGTGGMGEVYLAEDTELDRKVALKFLPLHLCQDEDCRKRFKREAQAAAKLSHPNIIHVYEVSEFQGRPFFAMEHVEGRSLRDVKADELDIDRIVGIAIQLCDGLHSAHEVGVTHRDIKPSNIIIDSSGRPRLLDFGLATVKGGEHLTKTGSTLGTVGYMSPEQIEGKATDARSDLFSLGIVFYELITNKSPFRRGDETATLKAILQDTPEPLARYKSSVPDDLQRVVTKLLEKNPTLRYQSAAGVIPDLKKLSSGPTSALEIGKKRDRWNRYVVPSAIIVLLVVFATWYFGDRDHPTGTGDYERIMLAVLPFENLGDPEDEYFADGITDEITARLMRVRGLGVIGRASSTRYKGSVKTIREIGKELGSEYILTGTVRWQGTAGEGGRVRVTPRLINLSDQSQLWADVYDESLDDIFAVQTAMANEVVIALDIALASTEEKFLSHKPTASFEAYQYYQRGREVWREYEEGREDLDRAIALLERAVELDTTFADAYAELSGIHSWYVETGIDKSDARKELARHNAEMATLYDSLQAYSRVAWGYYYYYVVKDYSHALEEFEAARTMLPSNSETIAALGYVKRRLALWEESFELQKLACELNPYNFWILYGVTMHAYYMRSWGDMEKYANLELERFPDHAKSYQDKALFHLGKAGNAKAALEVIGLSPISENWHLLDIKRQCYYFQREFAAAIEVVRQMRPTMVVPTDTSRYHFHLAELYRQIGDTAMSHDNYDSARVIVERLQAAGEDLVSLTAPSLGRIYAGLGQKEDALLAARADTAAIPLHLDALVGMERLENLALTYIGVAEYDKALGVIDTLLSIPSVLSVAWIKTSPDFDPLRDDPRFRALIEKYDGN